MRENRIRKIWKEGGAVVNGWLAIPSSLSAETMSHQGYDSLTIDQQHGIVDYSAAVPMLQAISTTGVVPMTRVPWLDPGYIMKMLDAGAYGIICPMINTREQCETLVGACRYAPEGFRSFGPLRALMYAGADYQPNANKTVLALAMIETKTAMENLDDILSTPGLDGIYIGPSDLGLSLGGPVKLDQTDPKIFSAIETIFAATKRHGVAPGIHCGSPEYARKMIDMGFQLVTVMSDNTMLDAAAKRMVQIARGQETGSGGDGVY